ncbi:STAS domain-containing protein [Methanosphaerula palustris]|uniref:Anti-sigma-factor antagonist n=1 Tax=Methanosphaerula palustris (strain ATCC BAA-1556 / DSM 19958 / E1-9c) TaxID=521011 RepID=B8GKT8_METPE|nr:STAS domain-containing protein [Methanosphaerula palustris]ACL17234.1 anti-sigma-factor antagonist [Methanosphaerula palustris E1-9c]
MMKITEVNQNGCSLIRVDGRLDTLTAPEFDAAGDRWISGGRQVLDLSGLVYISSAGLRSLLLAQRRQQSLGGTLVLAAPGGLVEEVLSVAGFDTLFDIYSTVEEACRGVP